MLKSEYKRKWLKVTKNILRQAKMNRECVAYHSVCGISCDMRKCVMKSENKQKSKIKQATEMASCN